MGNKTSSPSSLAHLYPDEVSLKKLRESPALVWSPEDTASWFLYNGEANLAKLALTHRIDGECLLEPSPEQLTAWLGKLSRKEIETLSAIVTPLKSEDFNAIFLNPPPQSEQKLREKDQFELPEDLDEEKARDIIIKYHAYTSHTKDHAAPALSRNWVYQPKISRRYYGSPVIKLEIPPSNELEWVNSHLLDSLLYYSFSISAAQDSAQSSMWPRAKGTKRVNPSSGGLHPVEINLIRKQDNAYELTHYSPMQHGLELRKRVPIGELQLELDEFPEGWIFAISTIVWREVWKYGPRGWRYTQLDIGHALASLAISAHLHHCPIQVLDPANFDFIHSCFGLQSASQLIDSDHRELERVNLLIHVSPPGSEGHAYQFSQHGVRFLQQFHAHGAPLLGNPNQIFSRSNTKENWPYLTAIQVASEVKQQAPVQNQGAREPPQIPALTQLYSDEVRVRKSIRKRRSVLSFDGKSTMGIAQFVRCLSGTLLELHPVASKALDFARDECGPLVFGIWVHRVKNLTPGLYVIVPDAELVERLQQEYLQSPREHAEGWSRVQNAEIPDWLPLYFVSADLQSSLFDKKSSKVGAKSDLEAQAGEVSCYQKIAVASSFTVAMFAPVDSAGLQVPRSYTYQHWRAGLVGQLLYLQAYEENAGATGMGCFMDDLSSMAFHFKTYQPVYHFAVGIPKSDVRYSPYAYAGRFFPDA